MPPLPTQLLPDRRSAWWQPPATTAWAALNRVKSRRPGGAIQRPVHLTSTAARRPARTRPGPRHGRGLRRPRKRPLGPASSSP